MNNTIERIEGNKDLFNSLSEDKKKRLLNDKLPLEERLKLANNLWGQIEAEK